MGRVSGKRLARGLAAAALATLVWAGFASRKPVLEWWYLRKLEAADDPEREQAARCLAGLRSARAVPRLIELFRLDREYRYAGYPYPLSGVDFFNTWSDSILRIGVRGLPALIEAAGSPDPQVRHIAFWTLFKLGLEAEPAVPALLEKLKDRNPGVRNYAAEVLGTLGPEAAPRIVPALRRALADEKFYVQATAARTLGSLGPAAREAVPELEKCLENRWGNVVDEAQKALARIRAEAQP